MFILNVFGFYINTLTRQYHVAAGGHLGISDYTKNVVADCHIIILPTRQVAADCHIPIYFLFHFDVLTLK